MDGWMGWRLYTWAKLGQDVEKTRKQASPEPLHVLLVHDVCMIILLNSYCSGSLKLDDVSKMSSFRYLLASSVMIETAIHLVLNLDATFQADCRDAAMCFGILSHVECGFKGQSAVRRARSILDLSIAHAEIFRMSIHQLHTLNYHCTGRIGMYCTILSHNEDMSACDGRQLLATYVTNFPNFVFIDTNPVASVESVVKRDNEKRTVLL